MNDDSNAALDQFGVAVQRHYASGTRGSMRSMLFNLAARTLVGSYCYLDHLPWFVRRVEEAVPAEELGRRMRRLGSLPNLTSLNSLALGYFGGRAQRRLVEPSAPPTSPADDLAVLDFWRAVGRGYLGASSTLPSDGAPLRILSADQVQALAGMTRVPAGAAYTPMSRALATLELFTFILNGESRIGILWHGPYSLVDGECMLVKELVGLQGSPLLWGEPLDVGVDSVVRAIRTRPLKAGVGPFGNLAPGSDPVADNTLGDVVLVRRDGEFEPAGPEALGALADRVADVQMELYLRVSEWTEERRAVYGAMLYATIMLPFAECAGVNLRDAVVERFGTTAARVAPALISGDEPPRLLQVLGKGEESPYEPVGGSQSSIPTSAPCRLDA